MGRTINYEAVKRNAFRDQGIVVAKVAITGEFERQFLRNIGRKLFGALTR